jgi:hypothetical protein
LKGFATLLLVVIALFAGYTYLQVSHLQADVARLKLEAKRPHASFDGSSRDATRLLTEATASCKRARLDLEQGQTRKAKREMSISLEKLSEVSKMMSKDSGNGQLTAAWNDIRSQMDKLWKQFSKETNHK